MILCLWLLVGQACIDMFENIIILWMVNKEIKFNIDDILNTSSPRSIMESQLYHEPKDKIDKSNDDHDPFDKNFDMTTKERKTMENLFSLIMEHDAGPMQNQSQLDDPHGNTPFEEDHPK